MNKFFVKNNQIFDNKIEIVGKDVNHILNVLRLSVDEKIKVGNLETNKEYIAKITEVGKEKILCNIIEEKEQNSEAKIDVAIFQGLPKAEKMEQIIQKNTELGVKEFIPIQMERSVVKLDEKNKLKKVERWQKIAESAAKQCKRDIIPKVYNVLNMKNIYELLRNYDIVLLLYEDEKENSLKIELEKIRLSNFRKIAVIVGPEGGISKEEADMLKENGAKSVTLGKRILRTETASVVATSIIMYEMGDIGGN